MPGGSYTYKFHDVGNVRSLDLFRHWGYDVNAYVKDSEEAYFSPAVVQDEFQSCQGQMTWLGDEQEELSKRMVKLQLDNERLWVALQLEQHYLRHLIDEHLGPVQRVIRGPCECPVVDTIGGSVSPPSPIRTPEGRFGPRGTPPDSRPDSVPPLESCSSDSFEAFWESLCDEAALPSQSQVNAGPSKGTYSDEEDGEEVWEDVSEGGSGSGGDGVGVGPGSRPFRL